MSKFVTAKEYAKLRGLNKSTVNRQIRDGKIPRQPDGLVDAAAADAGRAANGRRRRGGLFTVRNTEASKAPAPELPTVHHPTPDGAIFDIAFRYAAMQFCSSARQTWPAVVADMNFEIFPEPNRLSMKALVTAIMLYLVEGWAGECINVSQLPAINWAVFGPDAAVIKTECEALRAEWSPKKGAV